MHLPPHGDPPPEDGREESATWWNRRGWILLVGFSIGAGAAAIIIAYAN